MEMAKLREQQRGIDQAAYKRAIGSFLTGVCVITSGHEGDKVGMAASSVASVSLTPPTLLVCIQLGTRTHDKILRTGYFIVNIMAHNQKEIVTNFARSSAEGDKFEEVQVYPGIAGAPRLGSAVANIDCLLKAHFVVNTHRVFVGEVADIVTGNRIPLAYFQSRFGTFLGDQSHR